MTLLFEKFPEKIVNNAHWMDRYITQYQAPKTLHARPKQPEIMTFISALYEPVRCIKPNWAPSLCCMQPKYRKNFAVRRPLDFKKLISNLVPASTGRKKRKYRNFLGYDSHTNLSAWHGWKWYFWDQLISKINLAWVWHLVPSALDFTSMGLRNFLGLSHFYFNEFWADGTRSQTHAKLFLLVCWFQKYHFRPCTIFSCKMFKF